MPAISLQKICSLLFFRVQREKKFSSTFPHFREAALSAINHRGTLSHLKNNPLCTIKKVTMTHELRSLSNHHANMHEHKSGPWAHFKSFLVKEYCTFCHFAFCNCFAKHREMSKIDALPTNLVLLRSVFWVRTFWTVATMKGPKYDFNFWRRASNVCSVMYFEFWC